MHQITKKPITNVTYSHAKEMAISSAMVLAHLQLLVEMHRFDLDSMQQEISKNKYQSPLYVFASMCTVVGFL